MVLGRSWYFDKHVVHNRQANTYTLTKDRVKHKLKLLNEKEEKVHSAAMICLVDGKDFLKGMNYEHMCFSIIPKDSKEDIEEVLAEVEDILGEFFDIVLDNIIDGLSPIRKISHRWIQFQEPVYQIRQHTK